MMNRTYAIGKVCLALAASYIAHLVVGNLSMNITAAIHASIMTMGAFILYEVAKK